MDHLIDYDSSSSCSSKFSAHIRLPASSLNQELGIVNNVNVLQCNTQHAFLQDSANNAGCVRNCCHYEEGSSDTDAEGNESFKINEKNAIGHSEPTPKRLKIDNSSISKVIIAGDDERTNESYAFDRGNPHWEGRWAGHLFLPFPPMDRLDAVYLNMNEDSDTSDGGRTEDENTLLESHEFLPAARELIRYWAVYLQESFHSASFSDADDKESTPIVIIPHIPMSADWMKRDSASTPDVPCLKHQANIIHKQVSPLHVSLSRPIYLPTPSVDSFMSSISKSIESITSASKLCINSNRNGKIFYLEPHKAAIFTNDLQNRSFLTIPLSGQNAQWVKHALLPSIDSTMKKFGLETYYSKEGENCILHVSVASVKGNMVKAMSSARNRSCMNADVLGDTRSIPLFPSNYSFDSAFSKLKSFSFHSIPSTIPIYLDRVQCQFGNVKESSIKF